MPKTRPYLDNGFLELDNNTCERAVKPVALGRKNWMFAGSERGGKAMAIAYTLIEPPNSTVSIRKRSLPMFSSVSQVTRSTGLMNFCPGITLQMNDDMGAYVGISLFYA